MRTPYHVIFFVMLYGAWFVIGAAPLDPARVGLDGCLLDVRRVRRAARLRHDDHPRDARDRPLDVRGALT